MNKISSIFGLFLCSSLAFCHDRVTQDLSSCRLQMTCENDYHETAPGGRGCPRTKYHLPRAGQITDFIRVKSPIPDITEASLCFWISPLVNQRVTGSILSYAVPARDNEIVLFFPNANKLELIVRGAAKSITITISEKTHMCVLIDRNHARGKLYINGEIHSTLSYPGTNPVQGGGVMLFGQEQDTIGGRLDPGQVFTGSLEDFMMWYRLLSNREVADMSSDGCSCSSDFDLALTPDNVQLEGAATAMNVGQC